MGTKNLSGKMKKEKLKKERAARPKKPKRPPWGDDFSVDDFFSSKALHDLEAKTGNTIDPYSRPGSRNPDEGDLEFVKSRTKRKRIKWN